MPQMERAGTALPFIFPRLPYWAGGVVGGAVITMKGAGTTLAYIFPGLPYWAGVVLVGAVITLNVALGGMKGITLVQAFQYWAKAFAISVPKFVLMAVYGHYGKQVGANGKQPAVN